MYYEEIMISVDGLQVNICHHMCNVIAKLDTSLSVLDLTKKQGWLSLRELSISPLP